MLSRYALLSQCPPFGYSTFRRCQACIQVSYKPSAAHIKHSWVCVSSYQQCKRPTFSNSEVGSAETSSGLKQREKKRLFAGHPRLISNLSLWIKTHHNRKRRETRSSPVRSSTLLQRQQGKRSLLQSRLRLLQSRLQSHVRTRPVESRPRWRLRWEGNGRRAGKYTFRRLNRFRWISSGQRAGKYAFRRLNWIRWKGTSRRRKGIEKPSILDGPHRKPRGRRRYFQHFHSLGTWPKNTSWGSRESRTHWLEKFDLAWRTHYRYPLLQIPKEMQSWTSLDTSQVVRYFGDLHSDRNSANDEWRGLQGSDAGSVWRNVMLWCMRHDKKQGLMLLLATLKGRKYRPPRYMVLDALSFLAHHFLSEDPNPDSMVVDTIWLLTCKFIDGASDQEETFSIDQHLVLLVLQHSNNLRVLSFYWLLGLNRVVLHADTMLHFLERFVDMGRIDLAMTLLGTIVNTGYGSGYTQVQMACVKLLRACFDTQAEYTVRSNILARILEMGLRPDVRMLNTILLNAGEGDDFATAWDMYILSKEENTIAPNSVTYGVLLKGAVLSGDISNIRLVIREIEMKPELLQDLRLLNHALSALSLTSPRDEFGAMLDFYKQHCDLSPLRKLSLCGNETQAPPGANCYGLWPDRRILETMMVSYIKLHSKSVGLIHTYKLYYQHVKGNHPRIAPVAENDLVANAFLLAFGRQPATLQHCVTVVRHMLELSSQSPLMPNTSYSAPTVYTWSILVLAYSRNGQRRAAEKVFDMMHERGIKANKVTWNTLTSGYSGLQAANAAVATVRRMEAAGLEADAFTFKGLRRLRNRERLIQALKRNLAKPTANGEPLGRVLPPLNPKEQNEVSKALDRDDERRRYLEAKKQDLWSQNEVSKALDRDDEHKRYLEAKTQDMWS